MADKLTADEAELFGQKPAGPPWYRSTLADRVPRKYRKTRIAAFVLFGTVKAVRIGTTRTAVAGGRFTGRRVADARARRLERLEDPEWQFRRRLGGSMFLCAPCRAQFGSATHLNRHFEDVHDNEPLASAPSPPPRVRRRPDSNKTRTAPTTTSRSPKQGHGKRVPDTRRTAAAVKAYRTPMREIGDRAVTDNLPARMVRAGALRFGQSDPKTLGEMRELVLGMERALAHLRDGTEDLARTLRTARTHRTAINPELVNPYFGRAVSGLEAAEIAFTSFIAAFEQEYADAIRTARTDGHGGVNFLAS